MPGNNKYTVHIEEAYRDFSTNLDVNKFVSGLLNVWAHNVLK